MAIPEVDVGDDIFVVKIYVRSTALAQSTKMASFPSTLLQRLGNSLKRSCNLFKGCGYVAKYATFFALETQCNLSKAISQGRAPSAQRMC
jgi:hypothetical protein